MTSARAHKHEKKGQEANAETEKTTTESNSEERSPPPRPQLTAKGRRLRASTAKASVPSSRSGLAPVATGTPTGANDPIWQCP